MIRSTFTIRKNDLYRACLKEFISRWDLKEIFIRLGRGSMDSCIFMRLSSVVLAAKSPKESGIGPLDFRCRLFSLELAEDRPAHRSRLLWRHTFQNLLDQTPIFLWRQAQFQPLPKSLSLQPLNASLLFLNFLQAPTISQFFPSHKGIFHLDADKSR